jgi:hypothetical protein
VAFFLARLVVLSGSGNGGLGADAVFYGATALMSITDNAALTYLASLVPGLCDEFKVASEAKCGHRRGPDRDCQCAQSGWRGHSQGQV